MHAKTRARPNAARRPSLKKGGGGGQSLCARLVEGKLLGIHGRHHCHELLLTESFSPVEDGQTVTSSQPFGSTVHSPRSMVHDPRSFGGRGGQGLSLPPLQLPTPIGRLRGGLGSRGSRRWVRQSLMACGTARVQSGRHTQQMPSQMPLPPDAAAPRCPVDFM